MSIIDHRMNLKIELNSPFRSTYLGIIPHKRDTGEEKEKGKIDLLVTTADFLINKLNAS